MSRRRATLVRLQVELGGFERPLRIATRKHKNRSRLLKRIVGGEEAPNLKKGVGGPVTDGRDSAFDQADVSRAGTFARFFGLELHPLSFA